MGKNKSLQKKFSSELITVKQQEILGISKKLVEGQSSLALLEMDLTIEKCLSQPIMAEIFKGESTQLGFSVVNFIVNRFMDSFGFSNKANDSMIETLTIDVLERFKHESLNDIILFFKNCRQGQYGYTNRGVDSNLIFGEWYPKYMESKSDKREKIHSIKKDELNAETLNYGNVEKEYEKVIKRKKIEHEKKIIDDMVDNMDRQSLEDTIFSWEKEGKDPYYIKYLKIKRKNFK